MKRIIPCVSTVVFLLLAGCGGKVVNGSMKIFPAPGTLMDSASMPILADSLNDFDFTVAVIADSNVKDGIYDVHAVYGPNIANGMFTMPKGAEHYKPAIKKGATPYTFIVGFHVPQDTAFYEYFEVSGKKKSIGMKYLKAYTFE